LIDDDHSDENNLIKILIVDRSFKYNFTCQKQCEEVHCGFRLDQINKDQMSCLYLADNWTAVLDSARRSVVLDLYKKKKNREKIFSQFVSIENVKRIRCDEKLSVL
jgi:hypothetical protein